MQRRYHRKQSEHAKKLDIAFNNKWRRHYVYLHDLADATDEREVARLARLVNNPLKVLPNELVQVFVENARNIHQVYNKKKKKRATIVLEVMQYLLPVISEFLIKREETYVANNRLALGLFRYKMHPDIERLHLTLITKRGTFVVHYDEPKEDPLSKHSHKTNLRPIIYEPTNA